MAKNLKFSKHKEIRGKAAYDRYDNYDAIEVPYSDAIPSDYDGVMGVPISFLDKYSPEQFEIVGTTKPAVQSDVELRTKIYPKQIQVGSDGKQSEVTKLNDGPVIEICPAPTDKTYYTVDGKTYLQLYNRILIKHKGA